MSSRCVGTRNGARKYCKFVSEVRREYRIRRCLARGPGAMIEVEHLTKCFPLPGGGRLTALDDLSFTVRAGEIYGLLGPNGAGKTTTLRMLLGLLKPTRGQASIAGFGSSQHPYEVKRRVGLV